MLSCSDMGGHIGKFSLSFVVSAALLGCSATQVSPNLSTTVPARFVYTGNMGQVISTTPFGSQYQGNISGYSADPSTGELTPLDGFPFTLSSVANSPLVLAHDPQNRFLIPADLAMSAVHVLAINPTSGALVEVPSSPYVLPLSPQGVAIDPTGKFLYVADHANEILSFNLSATGQLTQIGAPVLLGLHAPYYFIRSGGNPLQIGANGRFLYFDTGSGVISVNAIEPASGKPTQSQIVVNAGNNGGGGFVLDPTGKYMYVMSDSTGSLLAYSIDPGTGSLTLINQNALSVETVGDASFALSPNGKFAYTIENGNSLATYAVANGMFTPIGTPLTGYDADQLLVDPSGSFLYAPKIASSVIAEFSIASSGLLTPLSPASVPSAPGPVGIIMVSQ
jgi:6-phosphogluconolactonase